MHKACFPCELLFEVVADIGATPIPCPHCGRLLVDHTPDSVYDLSSSGASADLPAAEARSPDPRLTGVVYLLNESEGRSMNEPPTQRISSAAFQSLLEQPASPRGSGRGHLSPLAPPPSEDAPTGLYSAGPPPSSGSPEDDVFTSATDLQAGRERRTGRLHAPKPGQSGRFDAARGAPVSAPRIAPPGSRGPDPDDELPTNLFSGGAALSAMLRAPAEGPFIAPGTGGGGTHHPATPQGAGRAASSPPAGASPRGPIPPKRGGARGPIPPRRSVDPTPVAAPSQSVDALGSSEFPGASGDDGLPPLPAAPPRPAPYPPGQAPAPLVLPAAPAAPVPAPSGQTLPAGASFAARASLSRGPGATADPRAGDAPAQNTGVPDYGGAYGSYFDARASQIARLPDALGSLVREEADARRPSTNTEGPPLPPRRKKSWGLRIALITAAIVVTGATTLVISRTRALNTATPPSADTGDAPTLDVRPGLLAAIAGADAALPRARPDGRLSDSPFVAAGPAGLRTHTGPVPGVITIRVPPDQIRTDEGGEWIAGLAAALSAPSDDESILIALDRAASARTITRFAYSAQKAGFRRFALVVSDEDDGAPATLSFELADPEAAIPSAGALTIRVGRLGLYAQIHDRDTAPAVGAEPTVTRRPDGTLDLDTLDLRLEDLSTKHPLVRLAKIQVPQDLTVDELAGVMGRLRAGNGRDRFPAIQLTL